MRSCKVAASLLATILGEIENLGSPSLLRSGGVLSLKDRDAKWWSDLLSARYEDVIHPALAYEVEDLLTESNRDWVTLLLDSTQQALTDPDAALAASRFPLMMFGGSRHEPACLNGSEVTDSHLHSGGSVSLRVLIASLATRMSPLICGKESKERSQKKKKDEETRVDFIGADGQSWNVIVLLAAARWSLRLLWYVAAGGSLNSVKELEARGLSCELLSKIRAGKFWTEVKDLALQAEPLEKDLRKLDCAFPDDGWCSRSLDDLIMAWRRRMPLGNPESDQFLLGLVRILVAIGSLAASRQGEGLGRFSDRFGQMGSIQGIAMGYLREGSLTVWKQKAMIETLEEVAPTNQVVGAEFRRTFEGDDGERLRTEILYELAVHHAAFASSARNGRDMSLTMPVSFHRQPSPDLNPAASGLGELRHVLAGCDALVRIAERKDGPSLMSAIWSIDVAGREIGSSNWPFQIGAQLLERLQVDLIFTIHAGESFVSQLNGVRRVGELFMGSRPPRRIGHALALSPPASGAALRRGKHPLVRAEAIMDLAWLHCQTGSEPAYDALSELVRRAQPQGCRPIAPDDWIDAYRMLHELPEVERRLFTDTGGRRGSVSLDELLERAKRGTATDRAFAGLAAGAPPELVGCDLGAHLTAAEQEAYLEICGNETEGARNAVIGLVKKHKTIIESCPTSNVTLAGLPSYREHPFWEWSKRKIKMTLSSDDPLEFSSNILGELRALLATDGDRRAVERAVKDGVKVCSGGSAKRLKSWQGYNKVVRSINHPHVPALE